MKRCSKSGLIKLALLVGAGAAVAKLITAKKSEWTGLSESEVRFKVGTQMPDRVPEEKRAAVVDKVVTTMKTRGLLVEDADEVTDAGGDDGGLDAVEDAQDVDDADDTEDADDEPSA